jgi:putative ABC transport system permease protein
VVRDRAWAKVISERQSMYVSPTGIDITREPRLKEILQLAPESSYREGGSAEVLGDLAKLAEPHTALIFAAQARRLGVTVGDYLTITSPTGSGRTNTIDVVVVAVAKDFGFYSNWSLFVPSSSVQELYQLAPDTSSAIQIYLKDPAQAEPVMGHLREVLAANDYRLMDHDPNPFFFKFERVAGEDWTGQKLDLTVWSDEISFLKWISTALDVLSVTLVGILMVIIGVGIMNSMWIAVRERTTEIGTVRAIGMTRGRVLKMFLVEAVLLGLMATLLGVAIGTTIATAVDAAHWKVPFEALEMLLMTDVLHLAIRPLEIFHVVWIFTAITALAALWPALRAARLEPVVAIQRAG